MMDWCMMCCTVRILQGCNVIDIAECTDMHWWMRMPILGIASRRLLAGATRLSCSAERAPCSNRQS